MKQKQVENDLIKAYSKDILFVIDQIIDDNYNISNILNLDEMFYIL